MLLLTKASRREARKCGIYDDALRMAVRRARNGLVDAQISATLVKQEVARPGEGRRTACRTIIAMRRGTDLAVVMHVFAKSEKANLTRRETDAYLELSKSIVDLTSDQIDELVRSHGWRKIEDDA